MKNTGKVSKKNTLLLSLSVFLFFFLLFYSPLPISHVILDRINWTTYDLLAKYNYTHNPHQPSLVTIIDIDSKSIEKYGAWRWPSTLLARLINLLKQKGVVTIALDIVFGAKENNEALQIIEKNQKNYPEDFVPYIEQLKAALEGNRFLVKALDPSQATLAFYFHNDNTLPRAGVLPLPLSLNKMDATKINKLTLFEARQYLGPHQDLKKATQNSGFVTMLQNEDNTVRLVNLLVRYHAKIYPAFALKAAMTYLLANDIALLSQPVGKNLYVQGIKLVGRTIKTNEQAQVYLPFENDTYIPAISVKDLFSGKYDEKELQNHIALIGSSALMLEDQHHTPVATKYPGILIQANLINHLIEGRLVYRPFWAKYWEWGLFILIALVSMIIFNYRNILFSGVWLILLTLILIFTTQFIFKNHKIFFIFVPSLMTAFFIFVVDFIIRYHAAHKHAKFIKNAFSQYLPPAIVDEIVKEVSIDFLEPKTEYITILFSDIRNFTSQAEFISSEKVVDFLNYYLNEMTHIIFKNHGTIDKYIGDAIMCFWNAPLKLANHVDYGLDAAMEMSQKIKNFDPKYGDMVELNMGIGLNTGSVTIGNIGSTTRRSYTAIGDQVNYASRLEALTKKYKINILLGQPLIKESKKYVFYRVDLMRVPGRKQADFIYTVAGIRGELSTLQKKIYITYHLGFYYYLNMQFVAAEALLKEVHELEPENTLFVFHLERVRNFIKNPPGPEWSGVWHWLEK